MGEGRRRQADSPSCVCDPSDASSSPTGLPAVPRVLDHDTAPAGPVGSTGGPARSSGRRQAADAQGSQPGGQDLSLALTLACASLAQAGTGPSGRTADELGEVARPVDEQPAG